LISVSFRPTQFANGAKGRIPRRPRRPCGTRRDAEWDWYAAHPVGFSVDATPVDTGDWPHAVDQFLRGLPEEFETRLFLRIPVIDREIQNSVATRASAMLQGHGPRALSKIYLADPGASDEFLGSIVDFPGGFIPQAADYRHWWTQAVASQIARTSPHRKWWGNLPRALSLAS
jgi:hypothetical protein